MTYEQIVSKVSESTGLSQKMVDRIYKSYWKVVREYMTSLPLMEDLTDEEFERIRPNINVPSLGKLYVSLDKYKRLKKYLYLKQEEKGKRYADN